jgi:hypothetical protein
MRLVLVLALLGCGTAREAEVQPVPDAGIDTHVHEAAIDSHVMDVVDATEEPPPPVPDTLAETGLYKDFAARTLADGVVAFDIKYPLWSDGAEKSRWLRLPPGGTIDKSNPDHWTYPKGTKAWKEFRRDGKRVETRFLEKTGEGSWGWRYVAYAWSEDGATAKAARLGAKNALGTEHDIPSQEQCDQCHSGTRDGLIGPGAIQWGEADVPGTGVVKEVLSYLHGNCGYCHSDEGRWAGARKLRLKVRLSDKDPATTPTYLTLINVDMAHADISGKPYIGIVPGNPDKSHIVMRMERRDQIWDMPPVGSEIVDKAAMVKIREWITNMP